MHNVVDIACDLVRHQSVTPINDGVLEYLTTLLTKMGFSCRRLRFGQPNTHTTDNLWAKIGDGAPHICFAGHTDVVPTGRQAWTHDAFAAHIDNNVLYGRGIADMKGSIAAFVAAVSAVVSQGTLKGSISFLITNDEEGPAHNGTKKVLPWLKALGEQIDLCVVGEPTNPEVIGTTIKHGRRGSATFTVQVTGKQGHVAYPQLARNAGHDLVKLLAALQNFVIDEGNDDFQPSHLEVVEIQSGAGATNVIPGVSRAVFNIRFNSLHTGETLAQRIAQYVAQHAGDITYELQHSVSAEPFLTHAASLPLVQYLKQAIIDNTQITPEFSTTGGTSDARFISQYYPVVEFGGINQTAHHVNENMRIADLHILKNIYQQFLNNTVV